MSLNTRLTFCRVLPVMMWAAAPSAHLVPRRYATASRKSLMPPLDSMVSLTFTGTPRSVIVAGKTRL